MVGCKKIHIPVSVFPPYSNYAHAVEVMSGVRTLYISGLNGYELDGELMPPSFQAQASLIWTHLGNILASANMSYVDLVSLRFYLADPAFDPENVATLKQFLGAHQAARTVLCARLLEPEWLIEVEAVAAQ